MKTILLLAALSIGTSPLQGDQLPNRDSHGEIPKAGTPGPSQTSPSASDKPPGAAPPEPTSGKSADERFIHDAGKAGRMEVKVAELALTQGSREDLKAYAAMLVKDLSTANDELAAIAKSLGVNDAVPSQSHLQRASESAGAGIEASGRTVKGTTPQDPAKEAEADRLQSLQDKTGMEFDTAFLQYMKDRHRSDIALFDRAKSTVVAPSLRNFVAKTLPVLISHAAALTALERKDPNRPDAKSGSRAVGTPDPHQRSQPGKTLTQGKPCPRSLWEPGLSEQMPKLEITPLRTIPIDPWQGRCQALTMRSSRMFDGAGFFQ